MTTIISIPRDVTHPGRRNILGVSILCGALAMVLIALSVGVGSARAATATNCPDVMFIGARGSGEPLLKKGSYVETESRGVGAPLAYMAGLLEEDVRGYGEEMQVFPVAYSADSVDDLVPSKTELAEMALGGAATIYYERNYKPYAASIVGGVRQTIADIRSTIDRCPEAELVLAGYSQGAMAVHQAELQLEREGDEEALDAIGGTLLLGDGDRAPNTQAKLFGGAPRGGEGVQVYLHGFRAADVPEPETTAEICIKGDIVCDFGIHLSISWYKHATYVHTHYTKDPGEKAVLSQAVAWLAEEMGLSE
ncbi:MAG TPA: cutinase family protein [Rubrobacter sp.]|nr:cutinase family protein [Rubrobacter sp.]